MTDKPKLTTKIATEMVERIEELQSKIDDIYTAADRSYAGRGNASVLKSALASRKEWRDAQGDAEGYLASFDAEYD